MKTSAPTPVPASAKQQLRRPGQVLKLFAAAVFLAFALPLILLAALLGWHQYRILTTWPAVDAVVTRADRTASTDRHTREVTEYSVRFTFRYNAAGRVYQSSSELGYTSRAAEADAWARQMPVGSHTRLRYDSHDPSQISLTADFTPRAFAVPRKLTEWAGLATALSAALLILGWRAGRQKTGSR